MGDQMPPPTSPKSSPPLRFVWCSKAHTLLRGTHYRELHRNCSYPSHARAFDRRCCTSQAGAFAKDGQLLKLAPQRFGSPLLFGIANHVPVPNPLPIGITNGNNFLNDIKQALDLLGGKFKPPPSFGGHFFIRESAAE
jgi:hypothetical protein